MRLKEFLLREIIHNVKYEEENNNAVAKSDKEELITALDIGSSHLRLLSGYVGPDKQIRIRGYKEIKSVGYSNGEINDIGNWQAQ